MFCVRSKIIEKLTGRSAQNVCMARTRGVLPYETLQDGRHVYDLDNAVVAKFVNTVPKGQKADVKRRAHIFREQFKEDRKTGKVTCEKTGEMDLFDPTGQELVSFLETAAGETLDDIKKKKEIVNLDGRNEKLAVQTQMLKSGLIDRKYVDSWVSRYLGILHNQFLTRSDNGIGSVIYDIVKTEPDTQAAIKQIDKLLSEDASEKLKSAQEQMRKNPL